MGRCKRGALVLILDQLIIKRAYSIRFAIPQSAHQQIKVQIEQHVFGSILSSRLKPFTLSREKKLLKTRLFGEGEMLLVNYSGLELLPSEMSPCVSAWNP